ncbi:probable dolichyl pyrophosphate Glc1Man9GlcNAc2 alpha-1,3-glucosyltransferase isoform X1 [Octopus sinensis]|uniref:Alpha-1,3-glucosyltransferase n=1 Tax=Octopus sinensis TaxID=2607531 RepID=A0A7E6F8N4_9MOLL|nr:probable dolichyl pyrophosphate Glc1Man9GlcNAc2 alpha-1,3-glucosyltransferase isoform X1 [Octopus sinensis]
MGLNLKACDCKDTLLTTQSCLHLIKDNNSLAKYGNFQYSIDSNDISLFINHFSRSTDFEVHRNWLSITNKLPVRKWYYEETSIWTLDYPPFFAWFEFLLSHIARYFDPKMLVVQSGAYTSQATVYFQRLSVILSDLVLVYAVQELNHGYHKANKTNTLVNTGLAISVLILSNFGLLLVDHIHFQYNGFLFGILLLSLVRIRQGKFLRGAFLFVVLLNFKHIFLYIAPAYFVYLLKCYCFRSTSDGKILWHSFSIMKLVYLSLIVISVFGLSFGPFIYMKQLYQVLSRLFPFKRGLSHAYWAPNFWALYNFADKALVYTGQNTGFIHVNKTDSSLMTGGLVQEFHHTVLPSITPHITLLLTFLAIFPVLLSIWIKPQKGKSLIEAVALCAFGSYMFGWHVHEKAILMVILPLSLLVMDQKQYARVFLMVSTTGHYSLFPLLFTKPETPIKICLMLAYTLFAFLSLSNLHGNTSKRFQLPLLCTFESIYLLGILPLEFFNSLAFPLTALNVKLPFLPLMLTSVYCSLGLFYSWLKFYYHYIAGSSVRKVKHK